MAALVVTTDLMVHSHAQAAGARTGSVVRVVASIEQAMACLGSESVRLVVLDLALPALDVANCAARLRSAGAPPDQIAAFGAHVHHARLAQASASGCAPVFSRGEFFSRFDLLLR